MEERTLVSVITVNYNNYSVTEEFLQSVQECGYNNLEIIVVDNSADQSGCQALIEKYPLVTFLLSTSNRGYAGGLNEGIKHARGEYLFLVNNDVEFSDNLINSLMDTFGQFENVGIVSPKFHYYHHPNIIEYAGYKKVNKITGQIKVIGGGEDDKGQYDSPRETNYAHGGAMMVYKPVIEVAGDIPEAYFLYYEEFDWCERILESGFKVYYQPNSVIYHKESMTTGKGSPLKTYFLTRNRILFMRRNVGWFHMIFFGAYTMFFVIPKNVTLFILRREISHLKVFIQAIGWHFHTLNSKKLL